MSISDRAIVIAEAGGAAALVVAVVAIASPGDVWLLDLGLHPMWLPIIVLSARYATRGLFPALGLTCGGLIAVDLVQGEALAGFVARTRNPADLIALTTAVLVAWVAMLHESRMRRATRRLLETTEAQRQAEDNVHALHASLGYLRSRHDRLDVSLGLWRNLASRLERGDAADAARAALELCEVRAGAQAGVVQLRDGSRHSTLAGRGQWSANGARSTDLEDDATVRAAVLSRQVSPAGPGSTELDCDVAVPVIDDDSGAVVGVIALRCVSPGCMRPADLRDLGVIAQWLAPSLVRALRRQFGKALGDAQGKNEVSL